MGMSPFLGGHDADFEVSMTMEVDGLWFYRPVVAVWIISVSLTASGWHDSPALPTIDVGTRLELFVDPYLIATLDNIHLELHTPCRTGVA